MMFKGSKGPLAVASNLTTSLLKARIDGTATPFLEHRHRGWELGLPAYIERSAELAKPPIIIAVGGGKGGVGKSLVSANLAVRMAGNGVRVLAIDLDIGGANLHTYFGISAPAHNLADAIVYGRRTVPEVILPSGVHGVSLIAGGGEEAWGGANGIHEGTLRKLFQAIFSLKQMGLADLVILDLGAGTHRHTLDFFAAAHLGLMTVLPEPTSIENAYLFLKTSLFRMIENVGDNLGLPEVAGMTRRHLLSSDGGGRGRGGYTDKLRFVAQEHPAFIQQVGLAMASRTLGIAINQVRGQKDIDVGKSMELIGERYFGFQTRYCGYLNYDEAAWKSLRNRRLLVVDFPHSVLSKRFTELARVMLSNLGY